MQNGSERAALKYDSTGLRARDGGTGISVLLAARDLGSCVDPRNLKVAVRGLTLCLFVLMSLLGGRLLVL